MCEIKRLNKLKSISNKVVSRVNSRNPLSFIDNKTVSDTGLTHSDLTEKIDHISNCCDIIELKTGFSKVENTFEQVMTVSAANFCKQHTVCPICADRLQARRRARFSDAIKAEAKLVEHGSRFAYIITYTVTDGNDLSERLNHLKESKKRFRLMGQRRGNGCSNGEWSKIRSGISTIEIKRGSNSGKWHVHAHDLVFTDKPLNYQVYDGERKRKLQRRYGNNIPKRFLDAIALRSADFRGDRVPVSKISGEWIEATGGDSAGVRVDRMQHVPKSKTVYRDGCIRAIPIQHKKRIRLSKMTFEASILEQAKEVLKYVSKPTEHSPDDMVEIIAGTYNKRFVATYGSFRSVPGDDFSDPASDDEETFVIQWDFENSRYGDPVPGKARDLPDDEEIVVARKKAGKLLGEYRRRRRFIIDNRDSYGLDLCIVLDEAKALFRNGINSIFSFYRHSVSLKNRMTSEVGIESKANCDKYHPIVALDGIWIPGITKKDIYHAIFA